MSIEAVLATPNGGSSRAMGIGVVAGRDGVPPVPGLPGMRWGCQLSAVSKRVRRSVSRSAGSLVAVTV
jgi:hypothetical protein